MADEASTTAPETARGTVRRSEPTKLQRAAARRAAEAKATVPHLYASAELRVANDEIAPVVVAVARALRDFPVLNGAYRDGAPEEYSRVNIGVGLPGPESLMVPTIFDADAKDATAVAAELQELAGQAAAGELRPPQLAGGTFTILDSGPGLPGGYAPVIAHAQAATLGLGPAAERPVVANGDLIAALARTATLACDARFVAGTDATAFLARAGELLTPKRA